MRDHESDRMSRSERDGIRRMEDEGGPVAAPASAFGEAAELARHGIVSIPITVFEWGGYRYTHGRDAIAAAKRGAEMSRAVFLTLGEGAVFARCLKENVGISTIDSLPCGGSRLVCMSGAGAERMRRKLKANLMTGAVARERHGPGWPFRN